MSWVIMLLLELFLTPPVIEEERVKKAAMKIIDMISVIKVGRVSLI
jgi:hypothetical protein